MLKHTPVGTNRQSAILRRVAACALAVALCSFGTGCEMTGQDATALLGLGLAGHGAHKNNAGAHAIGRGLIDLNAAERSAARVNVYTGQGN
jgi:hypothetical protein